MPPSGVHHVQITIDPGSEDEARRFYCGVLEMVEVEKPAALHSRGGVWLQVGSQQLHIGLEEGVHRSATRAHVAYEVANLEAVRKRVTDAGMQVVESVAIPGCDRFEFRDPFGNRVECIAPHDVEAEWLAPIMLQGQTIRLEPLTLDHAPGLLTAADSPETFCYFADGPATWDVAGFREWMSKMIEADGLVPFCVVGEAGQSAVGVTSYLDIRPKHRGVEIGWTWLSPSHRGTRTNPEMKRMMLAHAFDQCGARRVQLKTDLRNIQSQRAIEKLGAQREGVLRDNIVMRDGYVRSTVVYSITASEWPTIRESLDVRLAALPADHGRITP